MTCQFQKWPHGFFMTIKGKAACDELEQAKRPILGFPQSHVPSCKKVRSFLTTGNSGMMGGCMLWLLRMLRYLAMFLDGSKTSCRSPNSFSYLLGNFSHELRRRATGAKFRPLREERKKCQDGAKEEAGWQR